MNEIDDILGTTSKSSTEGTKQAKKQKFSDSLYLGPDANEYLEKVRLNQIKEADPIGIATLDQYFRFKKGNFVLVHGLDNVGKSSICWYLIMLAQIKCGFKPLLYCTENREEQVAKTIMQFRARKRLSELNSSQLNKLKCWFWDNFGILKTNEDWTLQDLLDVTGEAADKDGYNLVLGDPYNAFAVPSGVNGHEFHLEQTNQIKKFNRQTKVTTVFNVHPNTSAYRNIHKDGPFSGHLKPPMKGDVDGGAKFPAKADEYLTVHRYTEHPTLWAYTALFVRKVKDTETGGKVTQLDKPVIMKMNAGGCGFSYDKHQTPIAIEEKAGEYWVDAMDDIKPFFKEDIRQPKIDLETGEVEELAWERGKVFENNVSNFEHHVNLNDTKNVDTEPKGPAPF